MISWSHFPQHKGRISGIIISGFGFGTTAFNLVATNLINPDNRKATDKHDVITGIKTNKFWVLFVLGIFSNIPGLYVATAYKTFGTSRINNDDFLALTGSLGALFNGSFRSVWPQIMDKSTFKRTISVLLFIMCPLLMSFYYISTIKPLFLIWVCGIYACEGGLATLFPSVIAKCFGKM